MHAVQARDRDMRFQRGLVGDAVDTGAERLHPFQVGGAGDIDIHVLHHLPEGEQHVGRRQRACELVLRADHVD
jgi:hypothetical protein